MGLRRPKRPPMSGRPVEIGFEEALAYQRCMIGMKIDRAARALAEKEGRGGSVSTSKKELDQARWQQDGARKVERSTRLRLDYASKLKDADDAASSGRI